MKPLHWATRLKLRLDELGMEAFLLKGERDVARLERDEAREVARHIATFATYGDGAERLVELGKRYPWLETVVGEG